MSRLILCCAVLAVGLAGCGSKQAGPDAPATPIDFLPGDRVGELAEQQLEAEHLEIAVGTVTCPDLDWELNASVRCLKVSELSEGRRVKVPGTVTVTSTEGWGKLRVVLDDQATEFGIDGGHLTREVTDWVKGKVGQPDSVDCPYLAGVVGTVARCAVSISGEQHLVLAKVTVVEPTEYRTSYSLSMDSNSSSVVD